MKGTDINYEVNNIIFDTSVYDSEEEMFDDVAKVIQILTRNKNRISFRHEEGGIYILAFKEDILGCKKPYWLYPEDVQMIPDEDDIPPDDEFSFKVKNDFEVDNNIVFTGSDSEEVFG